MFKSSTISGPVAVAGLAFMLALGGCSSGSDAPPEPEVTEPMPEPDPEPTDLEKTQMAAKAAADAAKMASDGAATAASGADAATANSATLQTGAMAEMHAMNAGKYAKMAMDAYMDAKAASDAAAAATLASAAGAELAKAEAAQMAAEEAAEMAGDLATEAMDAAMGELMIDGTMKSVGDSSVDAMAGPSSVATGSGDDAKTVVTGLIKSMNPMATGNAITGQPFVAPTTDDLATGDVEPATKGQPYKQAAVERMFAIGKTLDSSDDMARLMIVTDYAGTNMVQVYAPSDASASRTGTKAGYISLGTDGIQATDDDDANNTPLRSVGMFVPAGAAAATPTLVHGDEVGAKAKPVEVFSYSYVDTSNNDERVTVYATLASTGTNKSTGVTTYTYHTGHDIMAAAAAADGPDDGEELDQARVTVGIPGPVGYKHLHFGVWAALGDAAKDGMQKVTDSGIGFVQSIGAGMTGADMPNQGMVKHMGNWVAAVQRAGDGSISLENGASMLEANLDKATLKATLTGLATLEGKIDGSSFKGAKATVAADNMHGLTPGGSFDGMFAGGFYGPKAAEAGGIFDFSSDASGAFRGAFGGAKMD